MRVCHRLSHCLTISRPSKSGGKCSVTLRTWALASDEALAHIYDSLGLGGEFGYRASAEELIDLIAPGGIDPFEIEQANQEFNERLARLFFVLGFVPVVGPLQLAMKHTVRVLNL